MTDLYDGQITDLLNNGFRYNPETIAVGYAVREEKAPHYGPRRQDTAHVGHRHPG